MERAFAIVSVPRLCSGVALCQPARSRPTFDIADVHVSQRSDWVKNLDHRVDGGFLAGDRYQLRRAMLDLIRTAYSVDAYKIFGGPSWLDYDRFEIVAKTHKRPEPVLVIDRMDEKPTEN